MTSSAARGRSIIWLTCDARSKLKLRGQLSIKKPMSKNFTVVFEKLHELETAAPAGKAGLGADTLVISSDNLRELDEISERRRLVAEITEPEPMSYTMT